MSVSIKYKGSEILNIPSGGDYKLNTSGKYLEDDIRITDSGGGGGTAAISVVDTTDSHGGTIRTITGVDISNDTVSASHLEQGYTAHDAEGNLVTGQLVPGGGSSYTLLASEELTVNTTSTSTITIPDSTMIMSRSNHYQTILYIQIRDKSGKRNGYFFGSDWYWTQPINGSQMNDYRMGRTLITNANGIVVTSSTSTYGLYPQAPPTFSTDSVSVTIVARYHSSYSTTIDGTYVVNVYSLAWPNNISPFA